MDEWGIDGVVNLSGMYPGPPREHARDAARGGGDQRRAHRRVHDAQLQAGAHGQGLRRGDGRRADGGPAPRRARPQDHEGPRPRLSRPRRKAPAGRRRSGPGSAVRARGRAGDAGRDPHRRSEGVLETGVARERTLGRAARPPRVVVPRPRHPVVAAALRRVRTAGRAPQEDHLHRRPLRQRPRGPRQRRAHARQVPELLHRHGGARARDWPPPAGEDADASTPSIRTACCSAPTPASAPTTPT